MYTISSKPECITQLDNQMILKEILLDVCFLSKCFRSIVSFY